MVRMTTVTINSSVDAGSARFLGRYALLALVLIIVSLLLLRAIATDLPPAVSGALRASLIIALATGAGALPALLIRSWTTELRDSLMGFSAGIMLGATVFTLIIPAIDTAQAAGVGASGIALLGAAILAGAALVWGADRLVPHEHLALGRAGMNSDRVRGVWLIVMTMALHHIPEGFAVGASYGNSAEHGLMTAIGIGIQSVPEGLVVAAGLSYVGYSRLTALAVAILTGLSQPVGAVSGALLSELSGATLPLMLAGAAGAMLFVISHEIIPESHRDGNETLATFALMLGFIIMLIRTTVMG